MDNIIKAIFGGSRTAKTAPRYRYDYGQKIKFMGVQGLPEVYEVHFANAGDREAARTLSDGGMAAIPDELFETGMEIVAWVFVHTGETDGETVYVATIPIKDRAMPVDYEPTPYEADIIQEAITLLNREIADIENAHNNALAAQAAQAGAEQAQTAAEQAQGAAESAMDNASGYADTAAGMASEASQSASDAQTAQAAAEIAQGRAESAADDAEHHSIGLWLDGSTMVFTIPREG